MPYRIKGTLKLPVTSQPAAGVEIEFISRRNYSPLLTDLSSIIKTSPTGAYDVTVEFGEYAVVLYWGCNQPSHIGKLFVFADTVTGLDLQTLLQQSDWQPATPEYIQQIHDWLTSANSLNNQAINSAAAAKASEIAVEADRVEVASNKNIVVSAQADVTSKRNDVTAKAAQVAANTATVNEKTPIAVAAANTATQKAASASTDAATASDAANRAETAAQAITGAVLDGGQCNLSSGFYPPALTVAGKKYSTVWYVQVGGTVSGITYDAGDVLRYTTANNAYFKIDAVDTATAQINAHAAKVGAHPISGVAGLEAALADKADVSSVFEAAPLPDVWIPFNDSLRMITGFGDYDRVYIGEQYLELNSRSASFERATTATYIDKSGTLRTAAINEPRFEKQGLLIEGQSTNLINWSSDVSNNYWAKQRLTATADTLTVSADGYASITTSMSITNTDKITFSVDAEIISPEIDQVYLQTTDASGTRGAHLNLVSGKITMHSQAVSSAHAEKTAQGYRFSVTLDKDTSPEITKAQVFLSSSTLGTGTGQSNLTGAIGKSLKLTHIQLEQLPLASSRILTSGSSVTRAADKCWINTSNNALNVGVTIAVSVYIETAGANTTSARRYVVSVGGGSSNNCISIQGSDTVIGKWYYTGNSVVTADLLQRTNVMTTVTTNTESYTWVNGSKAPASASSSPVAIDSSICIGGRINSTGVLFGHVRNFRIWHSALSDAQIKGLK